MDPTSKPAHTPLEALLAPLHEPGAGLHLVATPIGNLGDITLRALKTLSRAERIYCEDTRMTARLLGRYGIETSLAPYHDHNAAEMRPRILEALAAGACLALVSDAGTPLISDPGYKLVRAAAEAGHTVTAVPGPSAVLAGLCVAGLPTDRFLFAGFLPPKEAARRRALRDLAAIDATLVFYEAPGRLGESLADMSAILGQREAAVVRELTKLHEEARRAPLADLAAHYEKETARGEIVVVVGPPDAAPEDMDAALDAALVDALHAASLKTAVAEVCARLGLPRKTVYARALALSAENGSPAEETP